MVNVSFLSIFLKNGSEVSLDLSDEINSNQRRVFVFYFSN